MGVVQLDGEKDVFSAQQVVQALDFAFRPQKRNAKWENGFNRMGLIIEIQSSEVSDYMETTRQLMKAKPKTDAIIFSEDYIAIAGLHVLYELGIPVPGQVAVVGMNNSRYAQISNPALTSIDNMLYDTSLIAVRNLLDVLNGERVNHRMSIGSELVERSST